MLARWAAAGASAVMAAIVLLHAGLTPGGSWDGDEYYNFALERVLGWRYVWHRLYAVSPRPLSEAVLWLYDGAVTAVGAPLVAPFLLLLWTVLVAGAVLALWRPGDPGKAWRVAAALGLVAMFLLGHAVREMFYWPFGAAPYLLAMTGIVVVTFRLIAGPVRTRRDRTICALALLVAAGSSETGQFFVVGCTATLAVTALPGWFAASAGDARQAPWYLLPLLAALALLGVMLTFRVPGATAGLTADPTYFHRFLPSVREALGTLPAELFGRDPYYPAPGSRQIIVADVLLFLGLTGCLRAGLAGTPPPRRQLLALASGVVASVVGSLAAAYYRFGMLCCQRHHTFRLCLVVVLIVVLARFAGQLSRRSASGLLSSLGGPVCLVAAASILLMVRLPAAVGDYRLLGADARATRANWAALRDPAPTMRFHLPVHGAVIEGFAWQPGPMTSDLAKSWFQAGVLLYFGKSGGDVVETPASAPTSATSPARP